LSNQNKPVVAGIGKTEPQSNVLPRAFTRVTWLLWLASLVVLALYAVGRPLPSVDGVVVVDGLTVVMWSVVTFLSAIVQSYSLRYMSGREHMSGFFARVFGFTAAVILFAASDSLALLVLAWLAMGLLMADLIGFEHGWREARASARLARRYFGVGTVSLAVAAVLLWTETGATATSGAVAYTGDLPAVTTAVVGGAILLAGIVQSAVFPFHSWLLSSMTAPTPASALMHAGFVNAGGVLLARFSPFFVESLTLMTAVVVVGALGAVTGKLMKSVRPDIKSRLGCSTSGQMGFMVMQAGLGFFSAAITHLILHGFYKAYMFLSSGERVKHTSPGKTKPPEGLSFVGVAEVVSAVFLAIAGGLLFVTLTGKGAGLNSGVILTLLVVITAGHTALKTVGSPTSPLIRFVIAPAIFLASIVVYASVFEAVTYVMSASVGAASVVAHEATPLTPVHVAVAVVFTVAYVVIETGIVHKSDRLYVRLVNASQPSNDTVTTRKEGYE